MAVKLIIGALILIITAGYTLGFIGEPFSFIVFLAIAALALLAIMLTTVFLLIVSLSWKLLPDSIRKVYEGRRRRFRLILLTCFIILLLGGRIINYFCPHYYFFPFSLLNEILILIFAVLLGISLLRPRKRAILWTIVTAIFMFFFIIAVRQYYGGVPVLSEFEKLKSLPYLSYVDDDRNIEKNGVVTYNEDRACKGINIYNFCLAPVPGAYLMDLRGNVLHRWSSGEIHPFWHHVELCPDGGLLVVAEDKSISRLDWNSNVKWTKNMFVHHDVAITDGGDIYVLVRKVELLFCFNLPVPVINDYIFILSSEGEVIKEISLFKMLKNDISPGKIFAIYRWIVNPATLKAIIDHKRRGEILLTPWSTPSDLFHVNTIEIINEDIDEVFRKGRIIFCSRMLDLVGVIDMEQEKLVWRWGRGYLENPHQPSLLKNNNILIFDNGSRRGYSRIIELNPLTEQVVWEYKASPPGAFFSNLRGGCQRLPNGNTLITESDQGRVFEVTKEGKIVWDFYNPVRFKDGRRLVIYRMMRITDFENKPFLKQLQ